MSSCVVCWHFGLFVGNLVNQNACKQTKVLANKPNCRQTYQNSRKQTKFVCQNFALRQNLDKQINPFHIQITLQCKQRISPKKSSQKVPPSKKVLPKNFSQKILPKIALRTFLQKNPKMFQKITLRGQKPFRACYSYKIMPKYNSILLFQLLKKLQALCNVT